MILNILIEPHFFPCIQYLTKFIKNSLVIIDDLSRFGKQSYRNRAYIAGANKMLTLTVPLKQGKTTAPMKDVKIEYTTNWVRETRYSIYSAYGKAPYFDFYSGKVDQILNRQYKYLLDLDMASLELLLKIFGIRTEYRLRSGYKGAIDELEDWRSIIHPKRNFRDDKEFKPQPYLQAFSERYGFIPNLSGLDLVYNEGPNGKIVIQNSTA